MFPFSIPLLFTLMVAPDAILLPWVAMSPFYVYISLDTHRSYRIVRSGDAPPGVYAFGVELPMAPYYSRRYFLPWGDIEGIDVHRPGFLHRLVVNLRLRDSNMPWTFPIPLLGWSEIVTLRSLVEDPHPSTSTGLTSQVPELVVYGASGRERLRNS
jgi:hypothetical protein